MSERAIDLTHAQQRLAELVAEAADRGEEVILSDRGVPVARIVPIPRGPRVFGSARGFIRLTDDFDAPLEEFREYT